LEHDTNAAIYHYGQAGEDYHHSLIELAEEVAGLAQGPCTVPPAGWRCSRTKGHDGPCAATPTAHPPAPAPAEAGDLYTSPFDLRRELEIHADLVLGFALANADYAGMRRDVVKAQRHIRAAIAALQAQQPGAQAAAYCDPSDPINSTAFAWLGTDRTERHREPLFTHPQPPSIPEPSEADAESACAAFYAAQQGYRLRVKAKDMLAGLADYTARLRERIGGGATFRLDGLTHCATCSQEVKCP
jgi:hypothetical protein